MIVLLRVCNFQGEVLIQNVLLYQNSISYVLTSTSWRTLCSPSSIVMISVAHVTATSSIFRLAITLRRCAICISTTFQVTCTYYEEIIYSFLVSNESLSKCNCNKVDVLYLQTQVGGDVFPSLKYMAAHISHLSPV